MPNGLEPKPINEPTGKPWLSSKTNKFGIILAGLGLAILALPEFGQLVEQLPAEYQGGAAIAIAAITWGLRWVTSQPIRGRAK